MEEVEIDQEHVEQLKTSKLKFGAIAPIILDAQGNIVDGFHRREADSTWPTVTYEEIKTEEDRMLYAIASNWHRKEKSSKWKSQMLAWLAKQGYNAEEIAHKTRLKMRTVYKYLPKEFKEKDKVEAGKLGGEAAARRAAEVKVYKPKETWAQRKAQMQVPVSHMEQRLAKRLTEAGVAFESQKEYCIKKTVPDFVVGRKAFFIDHEAIHLKREEKDEEVRTRLAQFYDVEPVGLTYKSDTKQEENRLFKQIMENK